MIRTISRRLSFKLLSVLSLLGWGTRSRAQVAGPAIPEESTRLDRWDTTHDRVFLGGQFWANPMEDWQIENGWAQCQVSSGKRNIQSLTYQVTNTAQPFQMSVRVARPESLEKDQGAGFRIGIRSELNEVKSNCFAGGGIDAGVSAQQLLLGRKKAPLTGTFQEEAILILAGAPIDGTDQYRLMLSAVSREGEDLGRIETKVKKEAILGNIALVSQIGGGPRGRKVETAWRFTDWRVIGDAFTESADQRFGPLLWTQYTLHDSRGDEGFVLKLSALVGPMGEKDHREVDLHVEKNGEFVSLATAEIDEDASLALFRIPNWDASKDTPFRAVYREKGSDGKEYPDEWEGTIRANPKGRPLRIGAMTCQNDYGFPYAPVAENIVKLDPDLLYFSGDQIYESHGGFGIIRRPAAPAILNYLRKFYQHGWAFREAMRNAPTVCIPDDHDVFQGNYWGEGGAPMKNLDQGSSSKGGYIQPVRMVNAVHRTCTAHHPEPYDSEPIEQDMSVYYGELVYGGVGFAILGDRQWKSGPERVDTGRGRADHVLDPNIDTAALDQEGLVLLGERQEQFLEAWAADWTGHTMKVLLSQTPFVGAVTHHGKYDGFLKADLDCNGWPQTPRDRAVAILRKSKALHINGDQHLANVAQYGVEKQRDSNWSFCTPAISAGYPRWWRPDELGRPKTNRPAHGLDNTGEYEDGFGNYVYVYAVGNPEVGKAKNRYDKAHEKGSGFGLVTVDTEANTYTLEAYRFLIDATDEKPGNQFPGWPVTIHLEENGGENRLG
ncbi:MAG: alkaline phosphatase D family protein [Verrucomicrobiales bacterium]|nr:alkaline phosphatase D family protein [Verrucomicrobiales bacterium]